MRAFFLFSVAFLCCCLFDLPAAEVELGSPKPARTASAPTAAPSTDAAAPTAAPGATATIPRYRPAMLGTSPLSVINRINTRELMQKGQKDASLMFCCSVKKNGEVSSLWIYRQTPDSTALADEVDRCFGNAILIPAVYNHEVVHVLFFGTVTFKVVNDKPRLRIFANQEASELDKESDFVGPQPFLGRESKFEGLHYPNDILTQWLSGIAEMGMKIDADGNLKELKLVAEHPPLAGFGRAASEDFRVARFIPAFRDGKPVECSITLPVYYEP